MGRPVKRADWRGRIEPIHERVVYLESFVYRFESGRARRAAAPIDTTAALRLDALGGFCVERERSLAL